MKDKIRQQIQESIDCDNSTIQKCMSELVRAINIIVSCYKEGGRVICFGNGASAGDSQHIVGELVNKLHIDHPMLDSLALTVNTSVLTAIGNDTDFAYLFSRQIESLSTPKDVVLALSTSGNSMNIINGAKKAKELGSKVIALTGMDGGELANLSDVNLKVNSLNEDRIHETHILLGHILCDKVENELFGTPDPRTMEEQVMERVNDSLETKKKLLQDEYVEKVSNSVNMILETYKLGGKLILFGNGGSASDAEHLALKFSYKPKLAAMSLTTNSSVLTAIANDLSYEYVFTKQLETLSHRKDIILAISTSGNSKNVVHAVEYSRIRGIPVIGLTGDTGGKMADKVTLLLNVPSTNVARIQESHRVIGHTIRNIVWENCK